MQLAPHYDDVVDDIRQWLQERVQLAEASGIASERIIADPGIGFGKTTAHNLEILKRLDAFRELGKPMLIGTSRKAFIGNCVGPSVRRAGRRHCGDGVLGHRARCGYRSGA